MNYRYRKSLLIAAVALLLLPACATTTNVDYRQGYNFSAIRTLVVDAPEQTGSNDPRISGPLVKARVNTSIARVLASRGYRMVDRQGDARITWQLATKAGLESYNSGISIGYGTFSGSSAVGIGYGFPFYDVESYDEAVLTIDILSGTDGGLLWRGSASRVLGDGLTPEKLTDLVNDLVNEVLVQFPPGSHR